MVYFGAKFKYWGVPEQDWYALRTIGPDTEFSKEIVDTYINLNTKFSKRLLDIYSRITKLDVVFYTRGGRPTFSDRNWPGFCTEICKVIGPDKTCVLKYVENKIEGLHQCYAGLWCYARPVKVDGTVVGTFVVGHRRMNGKDKKSKDVLEKLLAECDINDEDYEKLMALWNNIDVIDAIDIELLDELSFLEEYVIKEHRNVIGFKTKAKGLAHEFLLPIQSIVADAENLFNEAEDGSELKGIAEDVLQQVIKLSFTAENIRGPLLEERDQFGYEFHDIDIYPIIQNTIDLFKKEAKKKYVIINDPVVEDDIPVSVIEMSEPHIKQVFFNLIHNAVKYSYTSTVHSQRYIKVVCRPYRNFYCVDITNYGIGIKPEELSEGLIFKDGYRGELARDRSRIGSGVGLGTVKRIVEMHHGYVEVKSEPRGIGYPIDPYETTVTVCIPFYQPRKKESV
jgi:signal transduction histidine kinase